MVHSESNNRSATVNSNTTQVHSTANADRQDGVKAVASAASPASEEVAQHGVAFWALGGRRFGAGGWCRVDGSPQGSPRRLTPLIRAF